MNPRKIPSSIKKLIKAIELHESKGRFLWNELYEYLDDIKVDSDAIEVSALQDGVGANELIIWLEEGHVNDCD